MEITLNGVVVLFTIALFLLFLAKIADVRGFSIASGIALVVLIGCCVLVGVGALPTEEESVTGEMQAVDGQYLHWSGKYNDHLHFYICDNTGAIEDVFAENYDMQTTDATEYTYVATKRSTKIFFLKYVRMQYTLYIPA
jgi:hypothetical protein